MKRNFKSIMVTAVVTIAVFSMASCYNDKAELLYPAQPTSTCDTAAVSYSLTVSPIAVANCAKSGCHNTRTKQNGYDMSTYDGMAAAASDPKFIGDVENTPGYVPMPNDGTQLTACEKQQLVAWANQGKKNN
jgi:hypothetical protein